MAQLDTENGTGLDKDQELLAKLGYKQSLSRSLSAFNTFGIAFSCCSILAGLTPLYGDALQAGGPATVICRVTGSSSLFANLGILFFLSLQWLFVSICTLSVAFSLAEICSAFPTTGGLYFWTTKLASAEWVPLAAWLCGYCNWLGLCVAIASTDLAMAQFFASLLTMTTGFQATNAQIFGFYCVILFLHGMVNSMTVRLNGIFNNASVWWHVIGTATIVVVVCAMSPGHANASWVFTEWVNNTGWSSGFYVFMLGLLQSQYTLSGYDAAAHMSEETQGAQTGGPFGIIMAVAIASLVGFVFLLGMTFSITDFDAQVVNPAVGLALSQIMLDATGMNVCIFLICIILGAQFFCGSALTLASSRMVYAFARDGALPFSKQLQKLNKEKSPVLAVWFNIAFSIVLGLPYIWSETAFSSIIAVNTIASSCSYLIPILCRIILARHSFEPGPFNLGRFSTPVGIMSSFWITFTSILFLCPTEYPVTASNMNYALVPFVVVIGISSTYFAIWGRKWFVPGSGKDFEHSTPDATDDDTTGATAMTTVDEKEVVKATEAGLVLASDESDSDLEDKK